jgi:hypothetical protein
MGKRNKKSFYKKQLKPFVKDNRVLLAALGGVAAGISLSNIIGSEKAHEILNNVEDSISNFRDKVGQGFSPNKNGDVYESGHKKERVAKA